MGELPSQKRRQVGSSITLSLLLSVALLSPLLGCKGSRVEQAEERARIELDLDKLPAQLRRRLVEGESQLVSLRSRRDSLRNQTLKLEQLQAEYERDPETSERLKLETSERVKEAQSQLERVDKSISDLYSLIERIKLGALADETRSEELVDEKLNTALEQAAEVYGEIGDIATLQTEAKEGQPVALFELGRRYERGEGVEQSDSEALRLYVTSAKEGHEKAALAAGYFYRHGRGTPRDLKLAARFYKQAADLGNAKAANNLAMIYQGEIKDSAELKDLAQAKRWFSVAATGGNQSAQLSLAKLYLAELKSTSSSKKEEGSAPDGMLDKTHKRVIDLLNRAKRSKKRAIREEAMKLLESMNRDTKNTEQNGAKELNK